MAASEAGNLCAEALPATQAEQVKFSIRMCPVVLVSLFGCPRLWGRRGISCCFFPGESRSLLCFSLLVGEGDVSVRVKIPCQGEIGESLMLEKSFRADSNHGSATATFSPRLCS